MVLSVIWSVKKNFEVLIWFWFCIKVVCYSWDLEMWLSPILHCYEKENSSTCHTKSVILFWAEWSPNLSPERSFAIWVDSSQSLTLAITYKKKLPRKIPENSWLAIYHPSLTHAKFRTKQPNIRFLNSVSLPHCGEQGSIVFVQAIVGNLEPLNHYRFTVGER